MSSQMKAQIQNQLIQVQANLYNLLTEETALKNMLNTFESIESEAKYLQQQQQFEQQRIIQQQELEHQQRVQQQESDITQEQEQISEGPGLRLVESIGEEESIPTSENNKHDSNVFKSHNHADSQQDKSVQSEDKQK